MIPCCLSVTELLLGHESGNIINKTFFFVTGHLPVCLSSLSLLFLVVPWVHICLRYECVIDLSWPMIRTNNICNYLS